MCIILVIKNIILLKLLAVKFHRTVKEHLDQLEKIKFKPFGQIIVYTGKGKLY